ncbi:MAG: family 16 glycosylhydrolase [Bacteroidia bacterium]
MRTFLLLLLPAFFLLSSGCEPDTPPEPPVEDPVLSIQGLSVSESNRTSPVFINLRLNKAAEAPVTFVLNTTDGTAIAGEDYTALSAKAITINPGAIQADCRIDIIGDEAFEEDENFTLTVSELTGATITQSEAIIEIINDDLNTNLEIPSTGYSTPTSYPGMTMVWSDEFDGETLDESNWTYEIGNGDNGWGNQELQFYRRENTFIREGNLVIQARNQVFNGFNYTSSRIITRGKYDFKFGRVDIRAVLPEGQGIWPALWSLGANFSSVGWPSCGEMDIMELVGHEPSKVHATVHFANNGGGHMFRGSDISLTGGKRFSDEFHVFSMQWEEDRVRFYMDDRLYHTVTKNPNEPYPFNENFFFIFNVAVGGKWPGSPDVSTKFPQQMIVDYIRVFQ